VATRRILLVSHPGRPEVVIATREVTDMLTAAGIEVVLTPTDGIELVCVLGGDGTILRGAESARSLDVPLLGVNLGHVGFLAEVERTDLHATVARVVERDYATEERMTLDVDVSHDGEHVASSWALNEVSVEKAARERMIELTVEVDRRPLSTWGCDGVVVATPTGSTAYAFSAGGPVVWPDVAAILVVPNSAHALFARPVVLGPQALLALEVIRGTEGHGVMWCDGRRSTDLPPGARIEVRCGERPVRLARLSPASFTDRLVEKFDLPVQGWRGNGAPR
jgi:NAD+ kinase